MIKKLLVANRGEIAVRIFKAAASLGVETVAVCSTADRDALFTTLSTESLVIGGGPATESYLNQDAVIAAALESGSDAVHPGYGFLAENADFAQRVLDAGLVWVGPSPDVMRALGLKIRARRLAQAAGVPVVPGFDESQAPEVMAAAADELGYPVMVKASAGGGGKGIRIASDASEFADALADAREESKRAFGDSDMIVERYITRPRHIEVQLIGDSHGSLIHLGTRECSLQRRHQKVIEEAPASGLSRETTEAITSAALTLGNSIGYQNAGTVEFVVDADTEEFFFLEVNTRLQVEHPVSEAVTGIDLVALQLRVASGYPLGLAQSDVQVTGHAFEARINAEDPSRGFVPQTGDVLGFGWPQTDVRMDTGVTEGSAISVFYDSMVAKLIVHGKNREAARVKLVEALAGTYVAGVGTNLPFLHWLVSTPQVTSNSVTTKMIDEMEIPDFSPTSHVLSGAADLYRASLVAGPAVGPWGTGLRTTPHRDGTKVLLSHMGEIYEVGPAEGPTPEGFIGVGFAVVLMEGRAQSFALPNPEEYWRRKGAEGASATTGAVVAPFPGLIASVDVSSGDSVSEGDVLMTLEAMKMLHPITASGSGVVASVEVLPGMTVESNTRLVVFEEEPIEE